ncbi:serine/threonine-protein kinase [Aquabacterium sp.]|uniref:serine/threonine-protein kinase n=1 Tax=Aquabacterium sp. TaxID=1872578 RepID=UPI0024895D95|nr:serine/threonine-protein kinase [Aquabacterium sp.]MDI1348341.1 serine/threonine-protein kinase [Aquabacterium sp.]
MPMLPWLLLLLPLAIWLVWRSPWGRRTASRARRHGQQVATDWADFTDTSPVAEGAEQARRDRRQAERDEFVDSSWAHREASRQEIAPGVFGDSVVDSVHDSAHDSTLSGARSSSPALDSWFDELDEARAQGGASSQPMPLTPPQRIQRVLQAQGDAPVDQAWETLRAYIPDASHREATLQTCERIAAAFEADARFEAARDVYEHMADIDPDWPEVRNRLMRVRGLAQVATVSSWGSVPPRPVPTLTQPGLGRYLIDKPLGQGAMGAVYQGHDPATGRRVAIKTMALSREFSGDELVDARNRFLREAEMAGRLQHPDIVGILDAGEVDGLAYIAMELVEGVDLSRHTQPGQLLSVPQVLRITARVAEALAYAHTRGVTHRDVKPANIMVDLAHDVVKVMDFGVARVADATRTRTGVVLGTPTFMSPEQLSGQPTDGRSDVYSLGVTLFQLLTGALPYRNDSMAALMRAIGREPPTPLASLRPDLPPALGDIVALALQKHPATRYANGQQMADDLRAVLRGLPEPALPAAQSPGNDLDIELG